MFCSKTDTFFSKASKYHGRGNLADAVILDAARKQNGRPHSPNPAELYQRAIDLCIEERRYEVLPELKRLRDRSGVTSNQLTSVRKFFLGLSIDYMRLEDECFAGN